MKRGKYIGDDELVAKKFSVDRRIVLNCNNGVTGAGAYLLRKGNHYHHALSKLEKNNETISERRRATPSKNGS